MWALGDYHSFAKVMDALGEEPFEDAKGVKHDWRQELFDVLKGKQKDDGSWANPTGAFLEQNKTNNTAWVKFTLSTESNGNRKVTVTAHSPCESPGMCGDLSPNR